MKTIALITTAVLIAGCGQDTSSTSPTTKTMPNSSAPGSAQPNAASTPTGAIASQERLADADRRPADNSGRNARDDGTTKTPLDQGQNSDDIRITQTIRAAITDRSGMSMNARNIKIITRDKLVTLRGPVDKAEERQWIVATASAVAGVTRVDDQLEITTPR